MGQGSFTVHLPPPWAVLIDGAVDPTWLNGIAEGAQPFGPEAEETFTTFLTSFAASLPTFGIDLFASLVVPGDQPGETVQAWCAMSMVTGIAAGAPGLRALVDGNPLPFLEATPSEVIGRAGTIARAQFLRAMTEATDAAGYWPYAASVRYALPAGESAALLMHFETINLLYLDELGRMFDAIAETAVTASSPRQEQQP